MKVHEHFNPRSWLTELKQRYDIKKTILNDTQEAFTVLFYPFPNKAMLVGRYDRTRSYGVVICRRFQDKWVEYDRRQAN